MAKKKEQVEEQEESRSNKKTDPYKIAKDLIKQYGSSIVKTGTEHIVKPRKILSITPSIDIGIGGGIPEGSFVLLAGDMKCGKTVTSLTICRAAQKQGRNVYYLNIEGRLQPRDLLGIKGLDPDKINVIGSFRDENEEGEVTAKILTGEEWISIAEHYIDSDPGCVVILDSVSQLATEGEINCDIGDRAGDGGYRLMAQFTKRMATKLPVNRCIVVGIQHLIANTRAKPGQKTKNRTGGRKVGYAVDVDLECIQIEKWFAGGVEVKEGDDNGDKEQIGQKVHWRTGATAILAPGKRIISWLRYGVGLDEVSELIELGRQTGFIQTSGSWYILSYMENHQDVLGVEWKKDKEGKVTGKAKELVQTQGRENIYALLNENPQFIELLKQDIYAMLGYQYDPIPQ